LPLRETDFVINEFAEPFAATRPDFAPIYCEIAALPEIAPEAVLAGERDNEVAPAQKQPAQKRRAVREHGPSLGRKRLEDVR
jgi:hypothetical protein